jgi:UDP-N-acetylglucosamine transferase subunit ALG13
MIFVSVGTHEAPFDRMLQAIVDLDLDEEVVIQYGPSAVRCAGAIEHEYLPFDDVVRYIREARAVVMHAGVGSIMIALTNGKRPIIMARRAEFGEHVDDHQVELARRLETNGLVAFAEDAKALAAELAKDTAAPARMEGVPWLGDDLGSYLDEELGEPRVDLLRAS